MTLIESAVSFTELAKAMKTTTAAVEAEASALRLFVGEDWAGRPAVSTLDAHALTSGAARRDVDHTTAWRAHQEATSAWEQERDRIVQETTQRVFREHQHNGAPAAARVAQEAVREAVERYEAEHPPPSFGAAGPSTATWFSKLRDAVRPSVEESIR